MIKRSFIIIAALVLAAATAGCAAGPQEYVTILAPMATQASETAAPVESTPMSTPTAEPTSEPTPEPTSEVQEATVGFVGDILMMTRQIADAKTETGYDFTESFLPMKSVFESVDIMCADFEGTFGGEEAGYTQPRETIAPATEENPNPTNPPMQSFSAPDELAKNLFDAGIDAVTTANNHAMDRDDAGLFRTINVLRAAGIKTAGTALSMEDFLTPCVIEKKRHKNRPGGRNADTQRHRAQDRRRKQGLCAYAAYRRNGKKSNIGLHGGGCGVYNHNGALGL